MLNLRVLGFCFAMPDEKNKRTVLQVKYFPFCTAVGCPTTEVYAAVNSQRKERTTTTNNEI